MAGGVSSEKAPTVTPPVVIQFPSVLSSELPSGSSSGAPPASSFLPPSRDDAVMMDVVTDSSAIDVHVTKVISLEVDEAALVFERNQLLALNEKIARDLVDQAAKHQAF